MRDGTILKGKARDDAVRGALIETVRLIRATGRKIIMISPTPRPDFDVGLCLTRQVFFGKVEGACDFRLGETAASFKAFELIEETSSSLPVIRLDKMICDHGICHAKQGSSFIFRDANAHLSKEGSELLGKRHHWMEMVRNQAR